MSDGGNSIPRITKAEHIGQLDTGDNIEAKRVANYTWSGSAWERMGASALIPARYDRFDVTATDSVTDTYVFSLGGTTVATVTVVYTDSAKTNISSVART
jgi:hypothetical protein